MSFGMQPRKRKLQKIEYGTSPVRRALHGNCGSGFHEDQDVRKSFSISSTGRSAAFAIKSMETPDSNKLDAI